MVGIQYRPPSRKRTDIYLQQYLEAQRQAALAEEQAKASGSGAAGAAGGIASTAALADELGLFDDLGVSEMFGSSAIGGGSSSALSGAGAMSTQPAMTSATAQSLSTGGSGLMTTAPAQMQTANVAAAPAEAAGAFDLAGIGSSGNLVLPAAGAIGAYDLFKNKRRGKRGVLQGAASGAAMGSYFGPWGTGIGAVVGLGAGLAQAKKSTKEVQADRWAATARPELSDKMKGYDYGTNNADFARTRDEKYLKADDIRVNPDNYNNVSDWDKWNKAQQDTFLNDLLSNGKVREKKGGIYYDDDYAQSLADKIRTGKYPVAQPKQIQQQTRRR